jgi:hypothetical protein
MDKNHGQTLEARFQKELRNLVRASSVPGMLLLILLLKLLLVLLNLQWC